MIRAVKPGDAEAVAEIYNYYVLNSTVTFEESAVSTTVMQERITEISLKFPWLVFETNGKVEGYAYASAWKVRGAYRYSVETTVYLAAGSSGKGLGSALYSELLEQLKKMGIHAAIGGVALPNDSCLALHKKFGFEKVAHFKEVGFKFDRWIDVTYWEKIMKPCDQDQLIA